MNLGIWAAARYFMAALKILNLYFGLKKDIFWGWTG